MVINESRKERELAKFHTFLFGVDLYGCMMKIRSDTAEETGNHRVFCLYPIRNGAQARVTPLRGGYNKKLDKSATRGLQ